MELKDKILPVLLTLQDYKLPQICTEVESSYGSCNVD